MLKFYKVLFIYDNRPLWMALSSMVKHFSGYTVLLHNTSHACDSYFLEQPYENVNFLDSDFGFVRM